MVCLFSSLEYAQLWVLGGACLSLTTSHCHSVGICIVHCVVLALSSQAVQSKACISAAKWGFTILLELVLKLFSDYFHWKKNETEKKWWRKCQSIEGTRVPVEIQIWVQHSGVFCFQIFSILLVLPFRLFSSHGGKNDINKKHCPWPVAKHWKYCNFSEIMTVCFKCTLICIWV